MATDSDTTWGDVAALRLAAEALTDAKNARIRQINRLDAASRLSGIDYREGKSHPLEQEAVHHEQVCAEQLILTYHHVVPLQIRAWASAQPLLNPRIHTKKNGDLEVSGVLFARIVGLTGNPRWAVPLKPEGEGAERTLVPDGQPHLRSLSQFRAWCGCGDPARKPYKGMTQAALLAMGKRRTVRPLLRTYSDLLVKLAGRSETIRDSGPYKAYLEAREMGTGKRHTVTCRNTKIWPMKPNGCGTRDHPEWGEVGSVWRPGHVNGHAHWMTQRKILEEFWEAAEGTR